MHVHCYPSHLSHVTLIRAVQPLGGTWVFKCHVFVIHLITHLTYISYIRMQVIFNPIYCPLITQIHQDLYKIEYCSMS